MAVWQIFVDGKDELVYLPVADGSVQTVACLINLLAETLVTPYGRGVHPWNC